MAFLVWNKKEITYQIYLKNEQLRMEKEHEISKINERKSKIQQCNLTVSNNYLKERAKHYFQQVKTNKINLNNCIHKAKVRANYMFGPYFQERNEYLNFQVAHCKSLYTITSTNTHYKLPKSIETSLKSELNKGKQTCDKILV